MDGGERIPQAEIDKFMNVCKSEADDSQRCRRIIGQLQAEYERYKEGVLQVVANSNKLQLEAAKEIERLKKQPRCPCGGDLEGLGRDIATKNEVWQCKKCQSQIIIEQALKEK